VEMDVNPPRRVEGDARVLTGDGVRGSGVVLEDLEGVRGVARSVELSGGDEGGSLFLDPVVDVSRGGWCNVGVDGDGGMLGCDLVDR